MRFAPRFAEPRHAVGPMRRSDERQRKQPPELAFTPTPAQAPPAAVRAPLWLDIERLAAELAVREPALREIVAATELSDATPARIVSAVLARRLAWDARTEGTSMQTVILETMVDDPVVLEFLEADLLAVVCHDPACRSALHALLCFKGFQALQTHRIAHSLWRRGRSELALWLSSQSSAAFGVDIHPAVSIGRGVMLDHGSGIVIGETALVEDSVTILHGVTLGSTGKQRGDRHPKIRYGAFLGTGATVLGNIEIGRMSKIGAGSVVLRSVPAHCTVTGVAAGVVRVGPANALQQAGACGRS